MIIDILKRIHRKFAGDTDYPGTGSEERLVRLDRIDDAISEWEDCVDEGYSWKELQTSEAVSFGGSGSDDLPEDFRAFIRHFDSNNGFQMAQFMVGSATYKEVNAAKGDQYLRAGLSPYVFWHSGGKIKSLPAIIGTIELPYIKKATRYVTGDEATEPEMENPKFIEEYAIAMEYLKNGDDTLYQSHFLSANEKLQKMKYNSLT